jgi:hypothetical protein
MYKSAVKDQVVYLKTRTPFSVSYREVKFSHYYKDTPNLKSPNSAIVFDKVLFSVSVKDLFRENPDVRGS